MSTDLSSWFDDCDDLAQRAVNDLARDMRGSRILDIAAEVRQLEAGGVQVSNFTIGDFARHCFSIPTALADRIKAELDAGSTNYPPAVGVPELRAAIRQAYARDLGLDYPEGTVQVGSGARPPIFSALASVVAAGDVVVYPVPSWNNNYYAYLNRAKAVPVVTSADNEFLPTVDDLAPHLKTARLVCLNSPLNPAGTVIDRDQLEAICDALLDENRRRRAVGDRPLMLFYDQVYWRLTFGGNVHYTPVGLRPEMARYTILVDAISKCWAATGLRVGWAVVPPWLRDRMKPLVGHMGAWAARPEQLATAALLREPELVADYMTEFKGALERRLRRLRAGLLSMKDDGLPVDALEPQGAIYLTVKFDLLGARSPAGDVLETDDDIRSMLLQQAKVAVVPFRAFGLPHDTGWTRFSVGAVTEDDIDQALERIRGVLARI